MQSRSAIRVKSKASDIGGAEELRGAARSRGVDDTLLRTGRVCVASVIALDLPDAGEDRPVETVARGGGHVESEVSRRDIRAGAS